MRGACSRPLYFLHIAKTGGTSITDAIARCFPAEAVFRNGGEITTDYLRTIRDRLIDRAFIAGHPHTGVLTCLGRKADVVCFLREPEAQAISHYLHIRREPDNPRHEAAMRLGFFNFVLADPIFLAHQMRTLAVAVASDYVGDLETLQTLRTKVEGALRDMVLVGVIERVDEAAGLFAALGLTDQAIQPQRLNAATFHGADGENLDELRRIYARFRDHPTTAAYVALEEDVYALATALLDDRLKSAALVPRSMNEDPAVGYPADRFYTRSGPIRGGGHVAPLAGRSGHLIHGPYAALPGGRYVVRFKLRTDGVSSPDPGRLTLEVAANQARILARRRVRPQRDPSRNAWTLLFATAGPTDVLEFRVSADGYESGRLVFDGVIVTRGWRARLRG